MKHLLPALTFFVIFALGCAPSAPEWAPTRKSHTFQAVSRQVPPPMMYNRVRWVNPPDVIPVANAKISSKVIAPVMQLDLKATTLKEAADSMAKSVRYQSYCSSKISGRRITMNSLGTIDELAQAVSDKAGINVVVDHYGREIRFLAKSEGVQSGVAPKLFEEKVLSDEHKSNH